jgi:hypothetical protein
MRTGKLSGRFTGPCPDLSVELKKKRTAVWPCLVVGILGTDHLRLRLQVGGMAGLRAGFLQGLLAGPRT